jgi:hypothetical protein
MMSNLKVGLLLDDYVVPAWIYEVIRQISAADYATISLVVIKENKRKNNILSNLITNHKFLLYKLYVKLEAKIFQPTPNAFAKNNLSELLKNVPLITAQVTETKNTDYFSKKDIETIRGYELDVFIRVGFRILKGDILRSAKYGIWSYHHGDNLISRGGPAGAWEVLHGVEATGSILQILNEDLDNGQVLYRLWSQTSNTLIQNINNLFWKSFSVLPRKLKELHTEGGVVFFEQLKKEENQLSFYSNKLNKTPGNFIFLLLISRHYFRLFTARLWRLFNFTQWILLYRFSIDNTISSSIFRYKELIPPKDKFWADPCIIFKNNKYYIFIEEYCYKARKGHISVFETGKDIKFSNPVKVLDLPYHLSYPFVFEENGEMYMIPESSANYTIDLYVSKSFPNEWEFKMNLMNNVFAVDASILYYNNKYWMFTNMREHIGAASSDELNIFYSDVLLSDNWKPHKKNPVVSDVRKTRSAGKLFYVAESLYRPSQDCSKRYGHKIIFNKVIVLNELEYEEQMVTAITPDWNKKILATHTFSYDEGLTFIDGRLNRRR